MQDALEIVASDHPSGARLFRVSGRLDSRGTPRFVRECAPPDAGDATVVLNLSGVTFLSSSGVGALLAMSEQARERGARLRIAQASRVVVATVELLNLREYLDLFDTEDDAFDRAA